jgi:hypothetical protein
LYLTLWFEIDVVRVVRKFLEEVRIDLDLELVLSFLVQGVRFQLAAGQHDDVLDVHSPSSALEEFSSSCLAALDFCGGELAAFGEDDEYLPGPVIEGAGNSGKFADVLLGDFAAGVFAFANDECQGASGSWPAGSEEDEVGFTIFDGGGAWRELHPLNIGEHAMVEHGVQLLGCNSDGDTAVLMVVTAKEAGAAVGPIPVT